MKAEYKVLIVDDSAFAQRVLDQHLAGSEFKVVGFAKSGGEALEQFVKWNPDVTLLDVILPDKTGVDILREIFAIKPNALVLMTSSMGTEDTVTESLSLGAKAFVQKPIDKATLLEQIRKCVAD